MAAQPSPRPSRVPLSIEPVIGWRTWSVELNSDGVCLTSPMQEYDWEPMQPNRARCRSHFGRQLPNLGCRCGLYAVSHLQRLPMAVGSHLPIGVVGSVAMWGRVIEHTAGYRGQLAYPDRIRLVCGRCFVARRDGVPTRIEHMGEDVVPVCDAHATEGRSRVEGMTPAELQQAVLSAYGVDVLPVETLHQAGFHAGPVPPTGLIPNARAELRQLRRSRSAVAALVSLVAALLVVRALGLFPSTAAVDAPHEAATGAPIAIDQPFPDALDPAPTIERVGPSVRKDHVVPFGVVCGHRVGDRAEIVGCGSPGELFGFYASPAEPRRECTAGNAYSRRPGFSVCWLDLSRGIGPGLDLLRLPGVRRWDLA